MGCAPAKAVCDPERRGNGQPVVLTATTCELGVQLCSHALGDYVIDVPPGSHGAAIGLKEGDVIDKAGHPGKTQYPVKYYQGLNKVLLFVANTEDISPTCPLQLNVLRGERRPSKIEFKPELKPRMSNASTAAMTDVQALSKNSLMN
jgi:hypothetical protein